MGSAESITELRVNQCFAMEAPVLQVDDTFYEYYKLHDETIFRNVLNAK
jgi:hypothetical protein